MRWRRPRKTGWVLVLVLCIMLAVSTAVVIERRLVPALTTIARRKTEVVTTNALNDVLLETMQQELTYNKLIHIEKDRHGNIVFMQPNLVAVNRIKLNALRELQGQLGPLQQLSFDIPAGQVLGSRLFATRGPTIRVVVVHTGTVSISVREEFEAAGINQVRHALHLTAGADMQIVVPLHRETIQITSEIPLVESVIVGEVPDSYFNFRWNR